MTQRLKELINRWRSIEINECADMVESAMCPQWVPVAERLPHHSEMVFVLCDDGRTEFGRYAGKGI